MRRFERERWWDGGPKLRRLPVAAPPFACGSSVRWREIGLSVEQGKHTSSFLLVPAASEQDHRPALRNKNVSEMWFREWNLNEARGAVGAGTGRATAPDIIFARPASMAHKYLEEIRFYIESEAFH